MTTGQALAQSAERFPSEVDYDELMQKPIPIERHIKDTSNR